MIHDLIEIAGSYISLTAINAISDEVPTPADFARHRVEQLEPPVPMVHIDYGLGSRLTFEGDAATVMKIIDKFCSDRLYGAAAYAETGVRG